MLPKSLGAGGTLLRVHTVGLSVAIATAGLLADGKAHATSVYHNGTPSGVDGLSIGGSDETRDDFTTINPEVILSVGFYFQNKSGTTGWDNPCLSCTSLMDGFDRAAYQVTSDAAFCDIAKAPAEKIHDWASARGWTQIDLVSGYGTTYQADYLCQGESDDMQ